MSGEVNNNGNISRNEGIVPSSTKKTDAEKGAKSLNASIWSYPETPVVLGTVRLPFVPIGAPDLPPGIVGTIVQPFPPSKPEGDPDFPPGIVGTIVLPNIEKFKDEKN